MKAIIYTRVSTGKQQVNGVSLEAQEKAAIEYCNNHNLEVLGVYSDAITGSNSQRPEFIAALDRCKKETASLVVYSTSRFSRDTIDQLLIEKELRKAGSKLISLTDAVETETPQGEAMFTMLAAFNNLERRLIGERTKAALQYKKSKNELIGSVPHGYKLVGNNKLIKDRDGQAIIALVKQLKKQGYSLRKISAELARRGSFNCNNRPYAAKSINSMLAA